MTMEEVWKDMSLYGHHMSMSMSYPSSTPAAPYQLLQLQDYPAVPQPPCTPPPPTALTLSSTLEFTYLGSSGAGPPSNSSSGDDPFAAAAPTADIFSFGGGGGSRQCPGGGDRRQRRMIKNRESAARSRARKQAYTNELELELTQLRRKNEMLLKRHQDLLNVRLAMAAQVPDRPILQRCRSAPPRHEIN